MGLQLCEYAVSGLGDYGVASRKGRGGVLCSSFLRNGLIDTFGAGIVHYNGDFNGTAGLWWRRFGFWGIACRPISF